MTESHVVVCAWGFSDQERRALKSIFNLSTARENSYTLVSQEERITGNIDLVDGDDSQAMSLWRAARNESKTNPVVFVSNEPAASEQLTIARPLTLNKVFMALDTALAKMASGGVAPGAALVPARRGAHPQRQNGYAVLVVDDSLPVRKFMEQKLGNLDFAVQIDFAASGEQAVIMAADGNYDLVFLDVMLPGIDGYRVCKSIKTDKATKSTPVVMLTSKKSPFDKVKGSMSGCDAYLTKPPEEERLNAVIRKYLYHDELAVLTQNGLA
jgi:twitching motility two-component system response regulator PilG